MKPGNRHRSVRPVLIPAKPRTVLEDERMVEVSSALFLSKRAFHFRKEAAPMTKKYHFDTLALHAGQEPDPATGAAAVPIYQTSSFVFKDTQHAADLFEHRQEGHIYSRISNPTQEVLEKRIAALEGGAGALALASGQAAVAVAVLTIAGAGDEIVASTNLYGGTFNLFATTLKNFGINTVFVDPKDIDAVAKAITPKTKAVYGETLGNPKIDVLDIEALAAVTHDSGIPLIVDNTFASPYLCRPFEFGADIVVHSATKYIGGHGTTIGGLIVDSGQFCWSPEKYPCLAAPDAGNHGIIYTEIFGREAYIARARAAFLRDLGPCISPFNAFLLLQGIETLSLRMERHCSNTQKVAEYLSEHPKVAWVNYPGLATDPYHDLARKYLPKGAGAIFTFGVRGGFEAGRVFIENLKLASHLANVGDAKTLVIHPASTTHQQLSEAERRACGVSDDMIRVSVGLEDVRDIIDDFEEALGKISV